MKPLFTLASLLIGTGMAVAVEPSAALKALNEQIAASPEDARLYAQRAQLNSTTGDNVAAIADLTKAIGLEPNNISLREFRGSERLLAGQIKESLEDFDAFLKQHPDQAPYHWKRGIALYYADRFDDGVKQFDIHQTVNSADVENAVWRYLCMAKRYGAKAAREDILKIGHDTRVPMVPIYELYAGKADVDAVMKACQAGDPSEQELRVRLFYAHLYLGLYYESLGQPDKAEEQLKLAVKDYLVDHYMGGIAVMHLNLLQKKPADVKKS